MSVRAALNNYERATSHGFPSLYLIAARVPVALALTRERAPLHRLVRRSRPACGRLPWRAVDGFSRSDDSIPIHPSCLLNISRARRPGRANPSLTRLAKATGRYRAPQTAARFCVKRARIAKFELNGAGKFYEFI